MGDLFHEDVPDRFLDQIFAVMAKAEQHIFLLLTKRPKRAKEYILKAMYDENCNYQGWYEAINDLEIPDVTPMENVWLGVTAENQARADERIPILLQIPAAKRFVSVEPMLWSVDLSIPLHIEWGDVIEEWIEAWPGKQAYKNHIDWVICGGETGPGARPMRPDWVRSLRDQCQAARVPFFFKSWGDWAPGTWMADSESDMTITVNNDLYYDLEKMFDSYSEDKRDNWAQKNFYTLSSTGIWCDPLTCYRGECMVRVGKKYAGRQLDGQTWEQRP